MRVTVPGGEGRAVAVGAGATIAIENIAGGQVCDLFAFAAADLDEWLSAAHTRGQNWSVFPKVGESFFSNRRRLMLTVLADPVDGAHDLLIPACDAERYRQLGAAEHRSCHENLIGALAALGLRASIVPQPVNLFMPVAQGPDGALMLMESTAAPGDRFVLRAEMDLVVVASACPQDLVPLNAGGLSDLVVDVSPV